MRLVLAAALALAAGPAYAHVCPPCSEVAAPAARPAPAKPSQPARKVSFDRKGASVRALLTALGGVGGRNVVLSDAVTGSVTMKVEQLPWDQALQAVLKARHLRMEAQGNVLRIGTEQEFAAAEKLEQERIDELW